MCCDDKNMTPSSCKPLYIGMVILTDFRCKEISESGYDALAYFFRVFYYNPNSITLLVCWFDDRCWFLTLGHIDKKYIPTMHSVMYRHLLAQCYLSIAIEYAIKHVCAIAIDTYIINVIRECHQYMLRNCYRECYLIAIAYVIYTLSDYTIYTNLVMLYTWIWLCYRYCYHVYAIKKFYRVRYIIAIEKCYLTRFHSWYM